MIKTHNITGLKYLCITKRDDWEKYTGSGVHWNRHLKKHGVDISTELLYEDIDYDRFVEMCLHASVCFNVALSDEFANSIPEVGYGNGTGYTNFELWWNYASEYEKLAVYNKRKESLLDYYSRNPGIHKNCHKTYIDKDGEMILKLSDSLSKHWASLSIDERRLKMQSITEGRQKFLLSAEYEIWKNKLSMITSNYWNNITQEEYAKRASAISQGRFNMSDVAKLTRKNNIVESFKHSDARKKYNEKMKLDRIGHSNPAAKNICWRGNIMSKMDFELNVGKLTPELIDAILKADDCYFLYDINKVKIYDIVVCPYCNAQSNPNKKPSSFKRWHFENCKMRYKNESIDGNKIS